MTILIARHTNCTACEKPLILYSEHRDNNKRYVPAGKYTNCRCYSADEKAFKEEVGR